MLTPQIKETIVQMHQKEIGIREIARLLKISRNSVRNALRNKTAQKNKESRHEEHLDLVRQLTLECRGNLVRVQERLQGEHQIDIPYTSLTWLARRHEIKEPKKKRSGRYELGPGEEMQHDTTPYVLQLGDKRVKVQCAGLTLAYSRKIYIQFYPRFTRFEARVFLAQAFMYMQGVCPRCIIDNTSVIVGLGTGPDAIMAPEMEAFGRLYGVHFVAHRINDANRKARIERPFDYVQKNFLSGRTFNGWHDLNAQAVAWCDDVANAKVKREMGMAPQQAYIMEKPYLTMLPLHIPEVYHLDCRVVDSEGYIHLDTNRYSVPEKLVGQKVEVYKFWDKVQVVAGHQVVAQHERMLESRQARITNPDHHPPLIRNKTGPCREEVLLKGKNQLLDDYIAELKKRSRGRAVMPLRKLLGLKQTYPETSFYKALEKALHYKMFDLNRLEAIILNFASRDFFDL